ncbi:DsbA family protein [Pseudooceanicola sediminis]|uniref:DsbA family protein n=1 Tax=Pseudooceanicola sediminis TaxID=2211117 RepID=A0A399J3Y6_9RHOB|nr:DsbA family protein [Pseudooceanicola sediminis]KAA2315683.1 DsbA family protein [Puniceibacterium sp. HSS470]RII40118.1 DsbA family protein [Pseudooceanicola sediminis]|tara:strand:- start:44520 stop:45197 length:678 start_codon:yes stop_codon:yes gene_type:complete
MDRRTLIGGGIAGAAVVVAAGGYFYNTRNAAEAQTAVNAGDASAVADVDTSGVTEMVLGDADAPVTMMEYASFTCPHCRDFHNNVFTQLRTDYIDTGKVKFIYRDVYFDRYGLWASLIARCNGGMRFFGIADMLYEQQDQWLRGAKSEADIADNLRKLGKVAGLDDATLEACLADEDQARTLAAWYQKNATADDVSGTPTLIINGEKYSNMSYAELKKILDEQLG